IVDIAGRILKFEGTLIGVDEFDMKTFTLIPNPAHTEVRIASENDKIASIVVTDLKGSIIFSEENVGASEASLSVEQYSKGMYLVRITSEAGATSVQKLAIQ
ncbi:T9SS type A sorting domain-containing protein, partial [Altibacter sp.]|uniref:T9SS type A sorting domain-containing protein n=1 Tax=Altibacter sp. TaxID=2024823 RepID=UPI0025877EF8